MKTFPWQFYLALILSAGLGPGVGLGTAAGAVSRSFLVGLLVGVLVALLSVAWAAVWYRRVMRRRDPTFTFAEAGAYREASFELPLAAGEVFELCLEVLEAMPGFYATRSDPAALLIEGLTGGGSAGYFSFGAPGERITVQVAARGENAAQARVQSRPGTCLVVLDFGKNRENINTVSRHLDAAIQNRYLAEREAAERAEMQRALSEAKLSALEAHIEPHFLYNTLANAQLLTRSDPARADRMLGNLITYLRNALPQAGAAGSTLGRELERSCAYLDILRIRMGTRLKVEVVVEQDLLAQPFPPMMLQTLVENAVKHGLEAKSGGGTVHIAALAAAGHLQLTVRDDGLGLREGSFGTGLGLKNIRERLKLSFGEAASLELQPNAREGLCVSIAIPLVKKNPV